MIEDVSEVDGVVKIRRRAREEVVATHIRAILQELGVSENPGMLETPDRVARAWCRELFAGANIDPRELLNKDFDGVGIDELVAVHHIPFYSLCEHHLLPFFGLAHVGYIPNGRIVGLSKIARLVKAYAAQPNVQEHLTNNIADVIENELEAKGVIVVMAARHLCMEMRGIQAAGAMTTTSALRGVMLDPSKQARAEFLELVR